jgi:serine phosphatase RsbU (regulator of sigma subunit)
MTTSLHPAGVPGTLRARDRIAHSATLRYVAAVLLLLAAFGIDVSSGNEVSSSLFYIAPVAFGAWFLGRGPAVALSLSGALLWLISQTLVGVAFSKNSILYWNVIAEAIVYLAIALVVSRLQADRARERALAAQIEEVKDLLDREARAVGRLQHDLLPHALPWLPGYDWETHYATSTRAGGDYYDVLPMPDGRIGIVIADATGHGTPAAVLMAMAKALLRGASGTLTTPDATLARLNGQLHDTIPPGWFLTACLVVLDPASGRFTYALAGHEPPIVVRARTGAAERLPDAGGPPLGPFDEPSFAADGDELQPGDTLVLYTDGVTEAMNEDHDLFGLEGLQAALSESAGVRLPGVKARLMVALDVHRDGAAMSDDTTILMLRRTATVTVAAATPDEGVRAGAAATR